MDPEQRSQAIFGAFDGTASIIGLVYGLALHHYAGVAIATAGASAAGSATVSMAAGEYECGDEGTPARRRIALAGTMGVATAIGSLMPVAPFFVLPAGAAAITGGALAMGVAVWIGWQKRAKPGPGGYLMAIGTLLAAAAVGVGIAAAIPAGAGGATPPGGLPGETTFADGAQSYIFGTNDSIDYAEPALSSLPAVQADVKAAGLTLDRVWAYSTDSDATTEGKIAAAHNAGMACMVMLGSTDDLAWMEHVVSEAGSGCEMYEFGNEPDNPPNDTSIATVTSEWIADVPQLRALNPEATFGGPATTWSGGYDSSAGSYPSDIAYFLAKTAAADERADFISYHDYPCQKATTTAGCVKSTPGDFKYNWDQVTGWEQTYYGGTVPTGVSEYNFDPGSQNLYSWCHEGSFVKAFTTAALKAAATEGMAFANQFTSLNYSGYGCLDMFKDKAPYAPKPQEKALAAAIKAAKG